MLPRDEARGTDRGEEEEEEDAGESDGANDSLMKAEATRQKASLVFRSAWVLLRHRSHPLCVYTRVYGVSLTNRTLCDDGGESSVATGNHRANHRRLVGRSERSSSRFALSARTLISHQDEEAIDSAGRWHEDDSLDDPHRSTFDNNR